MARHETAGIPRELPQLLRNLSDDGAVSGLQLGETALLDAKVDSVAEALELITIVHDWLRSA